MYVIRADVTLYEFRNRAVDLAPGPSSHPSKRQGSNLQEPHPGLDPRI